MRPRAQLLGDTLVGPASATDPKAAFSARWRPIGSPVGAMALLQVAATLLFLCTPPSARAQRRAWVARLPTREAEHTLTNGDAASRERAARSLARRGAQDGAVSALVRALEGERDPAARASILASLAARSDAASTDALALVLSAGTATERLLAARTLGAIGSPEALQALIDALSGRRTNAAAEQGLRLAGERAVPPLLAALRAGDARVEAARTLEQASAQGLRVGLVRSALRRAATDPDPALREAALLSLAHAARPEDEALFISALDDVSAPVVLAALAGLHATATSAAWPKLTTALAGAGEADRPAILRAMLVSDPAAAVPILLRMREGHDEAQRALALDVALDAHSAELRPVYADAWRADERSLEVASALGHLPDGAGVTLLAGGHGRLAERELAIALRAPGGKASASARRMALRRFDALPRPVALDLRALVRDPALLPELRSELASDAPPRRAQAARSLAVLGSSRGLPWLLEALHAETSPDAFRALAQAATDLGGGVPSLQVAAFLNQPGTAPEAMALAAQAPNALSDSWLRRLLRRNLRAPQPRVRAGAARALSLMRDVRAAPSLVAALRDDSPSVRLAVASALRSFGHASSFPGFTTALRRELDERVRGMLVAAATAEPGSFDQHGPEVLRLQMTPQGQAPPAGLAADVLLPDGRWLRVSADAEGELLVPDLPAGEADVRVRLATP